MSHIATLTNSTSAKKSVTRAKHVDVSESISAAEGSYLDFLNKDIVDTPQNLRPVTQSWKSELDKLVGDMDVDLDGKG